MSTVKKDTKPAAAPVPTEFGGQFPGLEPVTLTAVNKAINDGDALRKQKMKECPAIPVSAWSDKTTIPAEARKALSKKEMLVFRRYGAALSLCKAMNASA